MNVIFLHGLNTYGDELFRIGPVNFGRVDRHLQKIFTRMNLRFFSVEQIGSGSLEKQAANAQLGLRQIIDQHGLEKVHLLGHSQGGLLARALAHGPNQNNIISVITIATPHFGTISAKHAINFHEHSPYLHWILKTLGYDTVERLDNFTSLTPDQMLIFNQNFPDISHIKYASVVCNSPWRLTGLPLVYFRSRVLSGSGGDDGMVETSSQKWGSHQIDTFLDHYSQMGFHFQVDPLARLQSRKEVKRVALDLLKFLHLTESSNKPKNFG